MVIFIQRQFQVSRPALMQKLLTFFSAKNIGVVAIFQDINFNITLANNFVKFWTTRPWSVCCLPDEVLDPCLSIYDVQHIKKALKQFAAKVGPGQHALLCSLCNIYFSIYWFCKGTMKALISLHLCAGWSGPVLSANYIRTHFMCWVSYISWQRWIRLQCAGLSEFTWG